MVPKIYPQRRQAAEQNHSSPEQSPDNVILSGENKNTMRLIVSVFWQDMGYMVKNRLLLEATFDHISLLSHDKDSITFQKFHWELSMEVYSHTYL